MEFIFKGRKSTEFGITVVNQPDFTSPPVRTVDEEISGTDYTLVDVQGFQSYIINMDLAIEDQENIFKITSWLKGEGAFVRSDDPDKYLRVEMQSSVTSVRKVDDIYTMALSMYVLDPIWRDLDEYGTPTVSFLDKSLKGIYAYQGAMATVNRTRPISYYPGKRNYAMNTKDVFITKDAAYKQLNSVSELYLLQECLRRNAGGTVGIQMRVKIKGGRPNSQYPARNRLGIEATMESTEGVQQYFGLWLTAPATSSLDYDGYLCRNFPVPTTVGQFKVPLGLHVQCASDSNIEISEIKVFDGEVLTSSSTAEPYSPAPEDDYGYTGIDYSTHLVTRGGTHILKYLWGKVTEEGVLRSQFADIKTFNRFQLYNNMAGGTQDYEANEHARYERSHYGNGVSHHQFQFRAKVVEEGLDLLVGDLAMWVGQEPYFAYDYHALTGVGHHETADLEGGIIFEGAEVTVTPTLPVPKMEGSKNHLRFFYLSEHAAYNTKPMPIGDYAFTTEATSTNPIWAIHNANRFQYALGKTYYYQMEVTLNGRPLLPSEVPTNIATQHWVADVPVTYDPETCILKGSILGKEVSTWLIHAKFGTNKQVGDVLTIRNWSIKETQDFNFTPHPAETTWYDGDDGATYIGSTGGTHVLKYYKLLRGLVEGTTYRLTGEVANIGNTAVHVIFGRSTARAMVIYPGQTQRIDREGYLIYTGFESIQVAFRSITNVDDPIDVVVSKITIEEVGDHERPLGLLPNEGNTPSLPYLWLQKNKDSVADFTVGGVRFLYTFPAGDTEVYLDLELLEARTPEGLKRDSSFVKGTNRPHIPPGGAPFVINAGDATYAYRRNNAWL